MNRHHETPGQPDDGLPLPDERRYREMLGAGLDLLDQGLTVFDAELRMVAWNAAFLRLLDFPESLARPGVSFEDFIRFNAERGDYGPGDPAQQVAERVARARSFQPHTTERIRPNGRILSIRGFPLPHQGFITVYTDVTEQRRAAEQISRHQAELEEHIASRTEALTRANRELTAAVDSNRAITQALRRSEQRLREITDAIPAAIAYVDKDRIYRYANKGYAGWFGWTSEQVPGHRVPEVIGQELFDTISADVGRAMAGERDLFDAAAFARQVKAPIRLINSVVAVLAKRGYLAQVASRDAGYVLMRAPETIRIRDLVGELMHEGGGHAEIEGVLMLDAPLKDTMAKIEKGVAQGFGDLTLADMVAAAPAGKPA